MSDMDDANEEGRIQVRVTRNFRDIKVSVPKLKKLVRYVCSSFGVERATVGIAIVTDTEITDLNKAFLGRRRITDCLSFDLSEPKGPKVFELVVNGEMAAREAAARGHSAEAELALYIVHSLLHQLGFDDATKEQAERMHRTEDEILQGLGFGSVYNKNKS